MNNDAEAYRIASNIILFMKRHGMDARDEFEDDGDVSYEE